MKLLKHDPHYEKMVVEWYGGEPDQEFIAAINKCAMSYEWWGRADVERDRPVAKQSFFQALGKLCFPNAESSAMADATAAYMKNCYMDGYKGVAG